MSIHHRMTLGLKSDAPPPFRCFAAARSSSRPRSPARLNAEGRADAPFFGLFALQLFAQGHGLTPNTSGDFLASPVEEHPMLLAPPPDIIVTEVHDTYVRLELDAPPQIASPPFEAA